MSYDPNRLGGDHLCTAPSGRRFTLSVRRGEQPNSALLLAIAWGLLPAAEAEAEADADAEAEETEPETEPETVSETKRRESPADALHADLCRALDEVRELRARVSDLEAQDRQGREYIVQLEDEVVRLQSQVQ
jgi:hypothetical protein